MKILEAQSATLTNYEVYKHLVQQENRYVGIKTQEIEREKVPGEKAQGEENVKNRPGNLETLRKELLEYFHEAPSPLACKPFPYNEDTIQNLLAELRSFDITKGEVIMMLNLRPTSLSNLNTIIQEMEDRFQPEERQAELLAAIVKVLGRPDGEAERQTMAENTEKDKIEEQKAVENQQLEQVDGMEEEL